MAFVVENWLLILVALVSGALLVWPAVSRRGGQGSVSVPEAVRLLNREKAVLLDVSDAKEFAAGHASGARNVPVGELETAGKALPSNKALPLVVMCPTGARAGRAAAQLRKQGFENARPLAGGVAAWREANMPMEKAPA